MKNSFETNPVAYWKNKCSIYKNRRNSYAYESDKWLKFNVLLKKAEYNLALWKNFKNL